MWARKAGLRPPTHPPLPQTVEKTKNAHKGQEGSGALAQGPSAGAQGSFGPGPPGPGPQGPGAPGPQGSRGPSLFLSSIIEIYKNGGPKRALGASPRTLVGPSFVKCIYIFKTKRGRPESPNSKLFGCVCFENNDNNVFKKGRAPEGPEALGPWPLSPSRPENLNLILFLKKIPRGFWALAPGPPAGPKGVPVGPRGQGPKAPGPRPQGLRALEGPPFLSNTELQKSPKKRAQEGSGAKAAEPSWRPPY